MNLHVVGALVALAIAFGTGWGVNGWRLGQQMETERREAAEARQLALAAARAREQQMAAEAAAADQLHYGEVASADQKIRDLEQRVAAGAGRLSVAARCPRAGVPPAGAAAGVGDQGERAELDAAARPAYFALRRNLVLAEQALKLCVSRYGAL